MRSVSRMRKDDNKGIVLLSGGIDSAVTLYLAQKYGYQLHALIFEYGQKHRKETECAKKIAGKNGVPYTVMSIQLPWSKSSLTDSKVGVPLDREPEKRKDVPSTYVPARNLVFLSYAVSCAESMGATNIFIGAHTLDYSGYPDCRPQFINSFERAANEATHKKGIRIIAPLIDKDKKDIVEIGVNLNVPFEHTWSCYQGGARPCGRCDSCRFRIEAFRRLNRTDPLMGPAHPAKERPAAGPERNDRPQKKSRPRWQRRRPRPPEKNESENSRIL